MSLAPNIVHNRHTNLLEEALPSSEVHDGAHLKLGQRQVVGRADGGYDYIVATEEGVKAFKLELGRLPFILQGGFGNLKKP